MGGGDSYGASLSNSASSGASLSGATNAGGGDLYGSTIYGPGSVIQAAGNIGGSNAVMIAAALAVGVALVLVLKK